MKRGGIRWLCSCSPHTPPISGISPQYISYYHISSAPRLKWISQTHTHACTDTHPRTASRIIHRTFMLDHDYTGVRCPVEEHKCFQNVPTSDTVILLQDAQTRYEAFLQSRANVWLVLSSQSEVAFTLINRTSVCVGGGYGRGGLSGYYLRKVACGWRRAGLEPQHGLTRESEGAHSFSAWIRVSAVTGL